MSATNSRQRFAGQMAAVSEAWTERDIAQLRQLWQAGRSAAEIAGLMGRSRNAVLGKIHRLRKQASAAQSRLQTGHDRVKARAAARRETAPKKTQKAKKAKEAKDTKETRPPKPARQKTERKKSERKKAERTGAVRNWNFRPSAEAERGRPKRINPAIWTPDSALDGAKLVPLIDLERHMCAWPYDGPDGKTLFCGCDVRPGTSWCASHHVLVFGGVGE